MKRYKKIAKDVLQSKGHRHTADSQAGNQGRDIDPQTVKQQQQGHDPHGNPQDEGYDDEIGQHCSAARLFARLQTQAAPAAHCPGAPDPDLNDEQDHHRLPVQRLDFLRQTDPGDAGQH